MINIEVLLVVNIGWTFKYLILGELLNQLKQLDRDVTRSLLDVSRKLSDLNGSKEGNPFTQFKKLLLSSAGQKELDALFSSMQEGMELVHY